jgi:hypothetical protein
MTRNNTTSDPLLVDATPVPVLGAPVVGDALAEPVAEALGDADPLGDAEALADGLAVGELDCAKADELLRTIAMSSASVASRATTGMACRRERETGIFDFPFRFAGARHSTAAPKAVLIVVVIRDRPAGP